MTTNAILLAAKTSWVFVKFSYGSSATRYTNLDSDDTNSMDSGATYTSVPTMDVKLPPFTADMSEGIATINVPLGDTFTTRASDGRPHAPIICQVWEKTVEPVAGTDIYRMYVGQVAYRTRNPDGLPNRVRFTVRNVKSFMTMSTGLFANRTCLWTLGGVGCGLTIAGSNGTLATMVNNVVTITGLPAQSAGHWIRGYVEYQGLKIGILNWNGTTTFALRDKPPDNWLTSTVTVFPGCAKTIEACRTQWANESKFLGLGYAIPIYNPMYELK